MHPQGKWTTPAAIISSVDRATHHNISLPSCAFLPNLPKASPFSGCYGAWEECILTHRLCSKLASLLPCIQQANGAHHQQLFALWTEADTTMRHFYPVCFAKCAQNQPIQWVLWGKKGMHPDVQVMPQACQSIATHPQGK